MVKVTIIDGNDEIELSTAPKENIKAYMVKGEPGSDGVSPTASISKTGDTATITVTDKNGTTEADVVDGFNPTVTASKSNRVTTLTITDIDGTRTAEILDGLDLTGGVPTNGVIGFDGVASDIPNGYEVTTDPFPGSGSSITVHDSYSSSTTEPYSANYVNGAIPTISDSYSTSTTDGYSANYVNNVTQANITTDGSAVKCGYKIDNKDVYVKRVSFGSLPNNATKNVATGIDLSTHTVIKIEGYCKANGNNVGFPLPFSNPGNLGYSIMVNMTNNNEISVTTGIDRSNYTGWFNIYYI